MRPVIMSAGTQLLPRAKIVRPFTQKAKRLFCASVIDLSSDISRMPKRPSFSESVCPSFVSVSLYVYNACSPYPFGHHSRGFSMRTLISFLLSSAGTSKTAAVCPSQETLNVNLPCGARVHLTKKFTSPSVCGTTFTSSISFSPYDSR